jgi:acyl carrier protein
MTLSAEEINNWVLGTIAEELQVSRDNLTPTTSLVNDLHADSLALTNIVMLLEEKLAIDIPDEVWGSINTVGDITSHIRSIAERSSFGPEPKTAVAAANSRA